MHAKTFCNQENYSQEQRAANEITNTTIYTLVRNDLAFLADKD